MRVIRNRPAEEDGAYAPGGAAVTIGNFDGMHRGHLALVERCRVLADGELALAMVTFEPLPQAFFRPAEAPARLASVRQKLTLLRSLGLDLVWLMRFDAQFAGLSAREFTERVLARQLSARHVVVGEDFRFGKGREGDIDTLRMLGAEFGFDVFTEPAVATDGDRISSSGIRALLAGGDFEEAGLWLGRPFRMEGHVVRGAGLGRKLGFPTANLHVRARPCPLGGVLAAFARTAGGAWRPAVTNLGRRPAVNGEELLLEVHFFDIDEDLYGQRLEVQFVAKLRDEMNFDSIDDLVAQMERDALAARAALAAAAAPA